MKHVLAWSTAILFTTVFAMITFDFHYSVAFSIVSFISSYAFWNSYYAEKKRPLSVGALNSRKF